MSTYDKGLLQPEEIERFGAYLVSRGIGWIEGKSEYQVMQAYIGNSWKVIARNGKGVISTDPAFSRLIMRFKQGAVSNSDTERLDFLINNNAMVAEYTASDVPFFYVYFLVDDCNQEGSFPDPRAAIDAAIEASKTKP